MIRAIKATLISAIAVLFFVSCGRGGDTIMVVSREEGSGTRSAFVDMLAVVDAQNRDITFQGAEILNSAGAIVTSVAANRMAIGYISMGAMDPSRVRILKINGVEATPAQVLAGNYPIARPFYVGTRDEISAVTQDFINFILSEEGQRVVAARGYVQIENKGSFTSNGASGRVTVAGSTSVAPLMERFREAYLAINPNAAVEIQSMGTSGGIRAVVDEVSDIAMSSRSFRDSELQAGIRPTLIGLDGIAIAVNLENPLESITIEQVRAIYKGQIRNWSEVK